MLSSILFLLSALLFFQGDAVVVVARPRPVVVARPVVVGRKVLSKLAAEPGCKTALEVLQGDPQFAKLLTLAPALLPPVPAILDSKTLSYTFFAPTNAGVDAFVAFLAGNASKVLSNKTMVTRLIEYHVVPGVRALSTQLVNGTMVPTALGATKTLTILVENGSVDVEAKGNTAKVVKADLQTCNGVIHAVDKVLLPFKPKA